MPAGFDHANGVSGAWDWAVHHGQTGRHGQELLSDRVDDANMYLPRGLPPDGSNLDLPSAFTAHSPSQ